MSADLLQALNQPMIRWPLTLLYVAVVGLIAVYGMHRWYLVWLFHRGRHDHPRPASRFTDLPRVTVQLPMFNESRVAQRIIDAACALDYPADKLQIQVLDDSTDDAARIARERVDYWRRRGVDIEYRHRTDRHGYKAGALDAGLASATGEFVVVFDADFIPRRTFLKRTIHHFTDPRVGMVQMRWGHLNREDSLLTRCQAIFLDGHFVIEHTARHRAGRWFNFNGTAGIWRRSAIETSGGWQHDTLTEDLDLSYRAQLAGWKFVYLTRPTCPAELPPEINAFKSQQHRWTKGSIQTARKLLPTVWRSDAPLGVKIEAFFHLTSPMVYLYITMLALLFFPSVWVNMQPTADGAWGGTMIGLGLFAMGTASASLFYVASQRAINRSGWATALQLPLLMAIGVGIAVNNARGCIEAIFGHESPFVRTPKYNTGDTAQADQPVLPTPSIKTWMSLIEIAMGMYTLACAHFALAGRDPSVVSFPFLVLFAAGYWYVGLSSLISQLRVTRPIHTPQPQTA